MYSPEDAERPIEMFIRLSGDSYLLRFTSRMQVSSVRNRKIAPDPAVQLHVYYILHLNQRFRKSCWNVKRTTSYLAEANKNSEYEPFHS
jgi:hypothetical protein